MKKFIKRLLIFLIPVAAFVGAWEYGLSKIQNSYSLKRAQLEAQAPDIQVLVLGPSLALRGVDPDYFCMKGYNVANVQQTLFYDTRITLKYLDKMKSLKVVLICIAYPSLWGQIYNGEDRFRDYFYADYWGIRYPEVKWYDIHIYSRILQYGNDKAWQYALRGFDVNLTRGYENNGWAIKPGAEGEVDDTAAFIMINKHLRIFQEENFPGNIQDIKTLLEELNRRKIHPVFYTLPLTAHVNKYMDKNRLRITDSVIASFCKAYHCESYNYQFDPRFSDSDFKDPSHLNEGGAVKISKIINEEILKKYCTPATN